MVRTRSMRKHVPEVIELSSTEEDEIHEDIDLTMLTENTSQKPNEKSLPQKSIRSYSNDIAHSDSINTKKNNRIDIYIPRSKFNIHVVEDDDVPLSSNILSNHQIKEPEVSLSLTIQDECLVLNEVNCDDPKELLIRDVSLVLKNSSPQSASEYIDEFFSAKEDTDEEKENISKETSIHEDTDGSETEDQKNESDTNPNESQAEPLDNDELDRSFTQSRFETSLEHDEEASFVKEKSDVYNQADDDHQNSENGEEFDAEENYVDEDVLQSDIKETPSSPEKSDVFIKAQDDDNDDVFEGNPAINSKDIDEVYDGKNEIKEDNDDNKSKNDAQSEDDKIFKSPKSPANQDVSYKQSIRDSNNLSFSEAINNQHDSQEFLDSGSDLSEDNQDKNPKSNNEVGKFFSGINTSEKDSSKEIKNSDFSSSLSKEDEDPMQIEDSKKKIDNVMKNDMFAYVSSSESEGETESPKKPVDVSLQPVKRKVDESSDDENDDLDASGSKRQKSNNNKSISEVELFFSDNLNDDDIFNLEKHKSTQKSPNPKDAKKALAALMPSLSSTQVVKRRSTIIPSVSKSPSLVSSEKSVSNQIGSNVPISKSDAISNATSSNNEVSNKSIDDADEKVKVTFISQLTGFSKCIVIVSLKRKKTLRSITDKIIMTIMKQKPGSPYTYSADSCSFYHKGVKLNKFNTISDLQKGPSTENVEITIVSADVEKDLFKTSYEKMKSIELEEGKLKKLSNQMETVDANYNKIDEELRQMEAVTAEKYTEEIGEVEAVGEEDDVVDDGKFSIKLLDKFNSPMVIKVTGDMTIADVFELYKKGTKRWEGCTVVIMFDGDVVELTDTLEDLGIEDDDMLEFVLK
ncbi:uncharacterized protein HGUI_02036 [Hanseniaspora guilliermondii]|uniref:Ubiquitin-like domain-containing protein n=1 Tax=Hanseniaspora guilliermondii TaxID=56406 RepID=A0A1L0B1Z1_9ASCO|nr:uncharacterized protein HGUI_02036 [Hanseniaspora guilliermondii]